MSDSEDYDDYDDDFFEDDAMTDEDYDGYDDNFGDVTDEDYEEMLDYEDREDNNMMDSLFPNDDDLDEALEHNIDDY